MPLNVGSIWGSLGLDASNFTRNMDKAKSEVKKATTDMNKSMAPASASLNGITTSVERTARAAQVGGERINRGMRNGGKGVEELGNQVDKLQKKMKHFDAKDFGRIIEGIIVAKSFYASLNALENTIASVAAFSSDMEKAAISMKYMFQGNKEAADAYLETLKDMAATTPFLTQQIVAMSRRLMAMGFNASETTKTMSILTDTAAATGATAEQLDRIVLALGQMRTNGKVAGQELRQLAEAGIPAYKILKEELGLTNKELMRIGDMKIAGDTGVNAILTGLIKRYQGANAELQNTTAGAWSTIKDDFLIISDEMTKPAYKSFNAFLRKIRDGFESSRKVMRDGGPGAWIEQTFPKSSKSIETVIASLTKLGDAMSHLGSAVAPVLGNAFAVVADTAAIALPPIIGLVHGVAYLADSIIQTNPWIAKLLGTIIGFSIAKGAAGALMLFWKSVTMGLIAKQVGMAVQFLSGSIKMLQIALAKNPITGLLMLLAAALMYVALSSKTVNAWLDQLTAKLSALAGINSDGIFPKSDDAKKWNDAIADMGTGMADVNEEADKAKDKFSAAFDELYQVPEELGKAANAFEGITMPDLGLDWTTPWEKDKLPTDDEKVPTTPFPGKGDGPSSGPKDFPPTDAQVQEQEANIGELTTATEGFFKTAKDLVYELTLEWQAQAVAIGVVTDEVLDSLKSMNTGYSGVLGVEVPNIFEQLQNKWLVTTTTMGALATAWQLLLTGETNTVADNANTNTTKAKDNIITNLATAFSTTAAGATLWAATTSGLLNSWVTDRVKDFNTWKTDVGTSFTNWSSETATNVTTWALGTALDFATWRTNVFNDISGWATDTGAGISTWVTQRKTDFNNWKTDTSKTVTTWSIDTLLGFATWKTSTQKNFDEWRKNVSDTVYKWGTNTGSNILTWIKTSDTNVSEWVKSTSGNFSKWANGVSGIIATWGNGAGKTFNAGLSSMYEGGAKFINKLGAAFSSGLGGILSTLRSWAENAFNIISKLFSSIGEVNNALAATEGGPTVSDSRDLRRPDFSSTWSSFESWVGENSDWLIPAVLAAAVVTTAVVAAPATGGLSLGLLALEQGGFVAEDQLVRMGEKGRREVTIPLENEMYMKPFADAVAAILLDVLDGGNRGESLPPMYVGTLVADDAGLRELYRRFEVIKQQEDTRRG